MPYYVFDLVIGGECRRQGGLTLEGLDIASDRAEKLASELCKAQPKLRAQDGAVRVADSDNNEVYRARFDPTPAWIRRDLL